ncbi:MAG: ABC transporter ATP-binding protein [Planctomycetota bacterium]|nr:ABC transporter ATP-binding protein [Planctomycetota bacterium]
MIHINHVTLQAGDFHLENASFQVPTGDYCVLMGKTGCGKTTVLEAVAGLKKVESGQIKLGQQDVTTLHPRDRNVGYMPQDGALFNTMSVSQNLAFALQIRNADRQVIEKRVDELATMLEITPLLNRQIHGLSGGERQRVALGRALSFHPATLLLDEPLSALDDSTREQMCQLLENVQQQTGVTVLHVTHSQQEAERLAQWIVRIEDGLLTTIAGRRPNRTQSAQVPGNVVEPQDMDAVSKRRNSTASNEPPNT